MLLIKIGWKNYLWCPLFTGNFNLQSCGHGPSHVFPRIMEWTDYFWHIFHQCSLSSIHWRWFQSSIYLRFVVYVCTCGIFQVDWSTNYSALKRSYLVLNLSDPGGPFCHTLQLIYRQSFMDGYFNFNTRWFFKLKVYALPIEAKKIFFMKVFQKFWFS